MVKRGLKDLKSKEIVRLCFYPFTGLITNPIIFLYSFIINLHVLKPKSKNIHFDLYPAFNAFFYFTRAWNLKKYGRNGKSPYLGLGNYSLSRCFHYSLFSLFAYWKGRGKVLIICMLGFWLMHLLFNVNNVFFFVSWFLLLFSSNFFANLFRLQNYNVVGWLFFPLGLYGSMTNQPLIAALGWFLASYGSFTTVFIGAIYSFVIGCLGYNYLIAFSSVPAVIKLMTHFYPFLYAAKGEGVQVVSKLLKAIGTGGKPKYKRSNKRVTPKFLYHFILYLIFIIGYFILQNSPPILMIILIFIYSVNSLKFRFADDQSIQMLALSVVFISTIQSGNWYIVPLFWLVASPIPIMIGFDHRKRVFDILPIMKSIDLEELTMHFNSFFNKVGKGEKILLAYEDPKDVYEKVFNGYRHLIELPVYLCMQKEIKCFPEWWGVFELNYEGAKNIWGVTPQEVVSNMKEWSCQYTIVYSKNAFELNQWNEKGLELVDTFNWNDHKELFNDYHKLDVENLKWYLLKFTA